MDYDIKWQLCDTVSRENIKLSDYSDELESQRVQFNINCKSGQIVKQVVKTDSVISTYRCDKELVKPGAALHAYSQGLIRNYQKFEMMLCDSKPKRLFEYK